MADAKGIADREDDIADLDLLAVAESRGREARRVDLEHGEIGAGIAADDLGFVALVGIAERDAHIVGALDDMVVGQDVAVRRDDHPRAETLLLAIRRAIAGGFALRGVLAVVVAAVARRGRRRGVRIALVVGKVEEAAEHRIVEQLRHVLPAHGLGRVNVDDTRGRALDDVRVAHAVGGVAVDGLGIDREADFSAGAIRLGRVGGGLA